jgi:hypothetical protein
VLLRGGEVFGEEVLDGVAAEPVALAGCEQRVGVLAAALGEPDA